MSLFSGLKMSTKPTLITRTDPIRTSSEKDEAEITKPKEEITKSLNNMLGALEGIINANVRTTKDNSTLTRSLTVLEDRFTKLEQILDANQQEQAKWQQYTDNVFQDQGREIDMLFTAIGDLSSKVGKLGTILESQLQTLHSTLQEFLSTTKSLFEMRTKKK
mgnify:CR=1 FL=1